MGVVTALPVAAFAVTVVRTDVSLEDARGFVDAVATILVAAVASCWALNRYFVTRVDAGHLRFDATAELVSEATTSEAAEPQGVLLYRIEIRNPAMVLYNDSGLEVEVSRLRLGAGEEPSYEVLHELTDHTTGPIEPGSWAAVSGAVLVEPDVRVIRLLVDITPESGPPWRWHELVVVNRPAD